MKTFKQANEVIEKKQEAVVLFTHGQYFSYDPAGNGETGKWKVKLNKVEHVDKVMIYLRRDGEKVNRIFLGNYAGIREADTGGRYIIHFSKLEEVGTSDSNWLEFAKSGSYPVGYVTA